MPSLEDFYHSTPPRIMGSETEYTTQGRISKSITSLTPKKYFQPRGQPVQESGLWLNNGGRLYVDAGEVLEYATPECATAQDVAGYERAGEIIARETAANLNQKTYKRSGYLPVISENELMMSDMSVGHHENYLSPIETDSVSSDSCLFATQALSSYLATRPIWSGAGIVGPKSYGISQKGFDIVFPQEESTSGNKYAYNNIDDRLEIRCGEGNMSEWAIVQKFAYTSLVLRLIEHEQFPEGLVIDEGSRGATLHRLSSPNSFYDYEFATHHQKALARFALDFAIEQPEIPEEEITAAQEILTACDNVATYLNEPSALELIHDRIDWAAKLSHMHTKGLESKEIHSRNLTAVMHDLKWEDIDERGPSRRWYDVHQPPQFDAHFRKQALVTPPITRARARVEVLQRPNLFPYQVDWNKITLRYSDIVMQNPYDPNISPEVKFDRS